MPHQPYFPGITQYDSLRAGDHWMFYPQMEGKTKATNYSIDTLPRKTTVGELTEYLQENLIFSGVDTNFANTNLTFTEFRQHDLNGQAVYFTDLQEILFGGTDVSLSLTTTTGSKGFGAAVSDGGENAIIRALATSGQARLELETDGHAELSATDGVRLTPRSSNITHLMFYDLNGESVNLGAPDALTASYSLLWPIAQSVGVRNLQNDGAGNLSWVAAGADSNFAVTDLTFTGDRDHDLDGNTLGFSDGGVVLDISNSGIDIYDERALSLHDSGSSNKVSLMAPETVATSYNIKLPPTEGALNEVMVSTGLENTLWINPWKRAWITESSDTITPTVGTYTGRPDMLCTNNGTVVVTLPEDSTSDFPIGTGFDLRYTGTGTLTFSDSEATIESFDGLLAVSGQYAWVHCTKTAADTWAITGNLA